MLGDLPKSANPEKQIPGLLQRFNNYLHWGKSKKAIECMEDMAALALSMAVREYRQMGKSLSPDDLSAVLQNNFKPHQNRGKILSRAADLTLTLQAAISLGQVDGLRSPEQKQQQADAWMELALSCTKVIISAETDEISPTHRVQDQRGPVLTMA